MSIFSTHFRSFFSKGRTSSDWAPGSASGTHSKKRVQPPKGFTVIELVVVVAIMAVLTTVMIFQQRRFDSATLLRALAYSVALSVRQAQVYGTSVREVTQGSSTFAPNAYGVHFTSGDDKRYTLFADSPTQSNGRYDTGEEVQTFTIGSQYSIVDFCGIVSSTVRSCKSGGVGSGGVQITSLTIYFRRPNPDARFLSSSSGQNYISAYIRLRGPGGATDTRSVTVGLTGQISVGDYGS
ncbi:MAG TPA: prepilin-type N-terminal cleavage/methylation domain-containing protein [Candidatus Paceibacterota bacterium]|nr:prepilin-type N-terminal cleavage/methylation domain-containing protein [Candidatus Paceibacterota bacterium]